MGRVLAALHDNTKSRALFRTSAAQGNAAATNELAAFYELGAGGLPKNDIEAARLYKFAADQANAFGQYNLGRFYSHGHGGLIKSDEEAVRFFTLSAQQADQGLAEAPFNLGVFYGSGRGGDEAMRLYRLAAAQGLPAARRSSRPVRSPARKHFSPLPQTKTPPETGGVLIFALASLGRGARLAARRRSRRLRGRSSQRQSRNRGGRLRFLRQDHGVAHRCD
jgi:hypothetical protein